MGHDAEEEDEQKSSIAEVEIECTDCGLEVKDDHATYKQLATLHKNCDIVRPVVQTFPEATDPDLLKALVTTRKFDPPA